MTNEKLPTTVRYVKNGEHGKWWGAAKSDGQMHLGWGNIPHELLLRPDFSKLEKKTRESFGIKQGATQDFNQLKDLLDAPSSHAWVTFEEGYLWWCTVRDGAVVNPAGAGQDRGNFWLVCKRPWSNRSLKGRLLAVSDLPGTVTKTAGFKGTVCTPREWKPSFGLFETRGPLCGKSRTCSERV